MVRIFSTHAEDKLVIAERSLKNIVKRKEELLQAKKGSVSPKAKTIINKRIKAINSLIEDKEADFLVASSLVAYQERGNKKIKM